MIKNLLDLQEISVLKKEQQRVITGGHSHLTESKQLVINDNSPLFREYCKKGCIAG